jgi:sterol desaturase/sphingolipid hydroxylase (fatty acid hydroxylase superfamily)
MSGGRRQRWARAAIGFGLALGIGVALTFVSGAAPFVNLQRAIIDPYWIQRLAGHYAPQVYRGLAQVWGQLITGSGGTLYWIYLLFALACCYALFWWERATKAATSSALGSRGDPRPPPDRFWSFLFPNGFLGNRNVRTDLFLFLTSSAIGSVAAFYVIVWDARYVAPTVHRWLQASFASPHLRPTFPIRVLFSLFSLLLMDLQFYAWHWVQHHTRIGWALHKTHHSQRELNIFTDDREHPLYVIADTMIPGVFFAAGVGAANFVAPGVGHAMVGSVTLGLFFFQVQHIFRHSHVLVRYPRFVEWFFQSPAFHIVHHSTAPAHMNKNLGNYTTIWDRLFGTLHVPQEGESYLFGTDDAAADEKLSTVKGVYFGQTLQIIRVTFGTLFMPFRLVASRLLPRR